MDENEPLMVNCGPHGQRVSAVVCQHMLRAEGAPTGFIENSCDPNNLQAWCHRCEEKFQQERGLTEAFAAFNDMAIVCDLCYGTLKVRHAIAVN